MRNTIIGLFFRSFLKGLIILAPIGITAYVIWLVFDKVDTLIPMFPRGVGFVIVISSVTVVGYFGTRFFIGKALFDFFDHLLERTPGIKFIYSTVKDIMSSFVGDKKRFTKPVWVRTHNTPDTWRIGFLTQEDMAYLGMEQHAAVYLPHAYAISGWVVVTHLSNIRPVTTMSPTEAMKFAVSGGITISDESSPKSSSDSQ